jgi:hypothetical protein
MKIGDKLYCHTPRNYRCDNDISADQIYTVMNIDDKKYNGIYIYGPIYCESWFSLSEDSTVYEYYGLYFHTLKEYRKLKLEKLNEKNLHL